MEIDNLQDRLDSLWAMLEEEGFYTKANTVVSAKNIIEELEAQLAKAVEALKFYAEADNYEDQHKPESCGCCYYLHDAEIKEDQGAKARTTLAELTGGKA